MTTVTAPPSDPEVSVASDPYLSGEYMGQPVFRKSPPGEHPALVGNTIKKLGDRRLREWLDLQGTREIRVPYDDSDRRIDPSGEKEIFETFTYFGHRYVVQKEIDTQVPWPIADLFDDSRGKRRR